MTSPRATSVPRILTMYSFAVNRTSSRMRMGGMRIPSSSAACLRNKRILSSRSPPWLSSTSGISAYPISSSTGSICNRSWTGVRSVAGTSSTAVAAGSAPADFRSMTADRRAPIAAPPAKARNGMVGSPGTRAISPRKPDAIHIGRVWRPTCSMTASETLFRLDELVTMMPAAVEITSAGIWVTSPSPTVRTVYSESARVIGIPRCTTPMKMPPTMLMAVIRSPAIASPRTNLAAPSIAP